MRDDYLAHYGVPRMKWGVRNAETLRKYAGPKGRTSKSKKETIRSRIGSVGSTLKTKAVSSARTRIENRRQVNRLYKENSTEKGRKEFDRLRKKTLRSHDPSVIERGMHTLTDSELDIKIERLNKEQKVRDLVQSNKASNADLRVKQENAKKAAREAKAASLPAKLLTTTYNATVNYAGKKAVDHMFSMVPSVKAPKLEKAQQTQKKSPQQSSSKQPNYKKASYTSKTRSDSSKILRFGSARSYSENEVISKKSKDTKKNVKKRS